MSCKVADQAAAVLTGALADPPMTLLCLALDKLGLPVGGCDNNCHSFAVVGWLLQLECDGVSSRHGIEHPLSTCRAVEKCVGGEFTSYETKLLLLFAYKAQVCVSILRHHR